MQHWFRRLIHMRQWLRGQATAVEPPPDWRWAVEAAYRFKLAYPPHYVWSPLPPHAALQPAPLAQWSLQPVQAAEPEQPAPLTVRVYAKPAAQPLRPWLEQSKLLLPAAGWSVQPYAWPYGSGFAVDTHTFMAPGRHIYLAAAAYVYACTPLAPDADACIATLRLV